MRVAKQRRDGELHVELLDDDGAVIPVVAAFLRHLRARGCSPNTLLAYAHDLQRLFRFLRSARLGIEDFTPARALDFLAYLRDVPGRGPKASARPLAPTTINRNLAAVSTFYEYLIVTEAVAAQGNPIQKVADRAAARVSARYTPFLDLTTRSHPVRRVLRVGTAQRLPRPLSDDQAAALLGSLRAWRDRAMFLLMLRGGLRPGEVLNLHLEDIQYGRRRVVIRHRTDHPKGVRTKSRVERLVDLHEPETLAALSAYVRQERPTDAPTTHVFLVGGRGRNRHAPLGYAALIKLFLLLPAPRIVKAIAVPGRPSRAARPGRSRTSSPTSGTWDLPTKSRATRSPTTPGSRCTLPRRLSVNSGTVPIGRAKGWPWPARCRRASWWGSCGGSARRPSPRKFAGRARLDAALIRPRRTVTRGSAPREADRSAPGSPRTKPGAPPPPPVGEARAGGRGW